MSEAGKSPSPDAAATPPASLLVSIETFQQLALRIGTVTAAAEHPNADRLLVLTVDLNEGESRQVVAGIKGSYQPAALVGKQVVVVANLKPATIRGVESRGMVLAIHDTAGLALLAPDRPVQTGSVVK